MKSNDMIKIPTLPVIRHRSPFFRDGFLSMSIIGKSGCGKTQFLSSILPGISASIQTVLIATVIKGAPVHTAIVNYFRQKGLLASIGYEPDEMFAAVDELEASGLVSLERPALLIFDDFNRGKATGPYWDFTIHAFTKLRNSGWNFIILAQQPSFIPTIVRNCTTVRVLFDCYTKSALTTFTKDVADRIGQCRYYYDRLIDFIREQPYTYILIQEHPFEVSAGSMNRFRPIIGDDITRLPSMKEICTDLGITYRPGARKEIDEMSKKMQKEAGNDSTKLY